MNSALPFWSASAGRRISSNTEGFMSAYSSSTRYFSETPRIVSGLSAPLRLITAPLIRVICKLLICDDLMIGEANSSRRLHIMSLACP